MEFRHDIHALRAVAVIAVLLYHFSVMGISGGFAGVDVFFVLSGYLMTGMILGGMDKGNFSLAAFYASRARRIIPALFALSITLLAAGWFLLSPSDLELLAKHANATITFTSNFTFNDEEGYFDVPSKTKWLLHSWSLSVEWQFYLLYPLLLLAIARYAGRRAVTPVLWLLGIVSLGASIALTPLKPEAAFYLLPLRMWELIAGGLVYAHSARLSFSPSSSRWLEVLGLALLAAAFFLVTPETLWPSYTALLPVIGTVMVLLARRDAQWMKQPFVASIGAWSYSIYLWHWPVVVALAYFNKSNTILWVILGIVLSMALGAASYRLVERPARRYGVTRSPRWHVLATLAAIGIVATASLIAKETLTLPQRVSAEVVRIDAESTNRFAHIPKECGFNRDTQQLVPCLIRNDQPLTAIVWGDSHAGSILGAVYRAIPGAIYYFGHQCALLHDAELNSKGAHNHCPSFTRQVMEFINAQPQHIPLIVVNRYAVNLVGANESASPGRGFTYTDLGAEQAQRDPFVLYQERLVDTLCQVAATRKVYAVLPIPEMGVDVPHSLARQWMLGIRPQEISISRMQYDVRNQVPIAALKEAQKRCGVVLLDPTPYLCDTERCYGARDAQSYYFDDDHLSETGNELLIPMMHAALASPAPSPKAKHRKHSK